MTMLVEITLRTGETAIVGDAATAGLLAIGAAKDACARAILAEYPEYRQRNAALGLLDESEVAAMRAHILACKSVEDAYTAAVETILAGSDSDADKIAAIDALS